MNRFDEETAVVGGGGRDGRWSTRLNAAWNIGENANGGYAAAPVVRALRDLAGHPDPISVTTHFLRPATGDADAEVRAEVVRAGRGTSTVRGVLRQDGTDRLTVLAALSDLSRPAGRSPGLAPPPPTLPPPDSCRHRGELDQGVDLPILSRLDVRIHPDHAVLGGAGRAVVEGWIRLADGTDPSPLALTVFADAFPPSVFPLLGHVGWVPTVELTVHVRRRPAPGWVRAHFECDDLHDGRLVESGSLWDATGALVARSRQLGLVRQP